MGFTSVFFSTDCVKDFNCAMILFMFPTGTIHLYTSIDLISFVGGCFYASSSNPDATFSR